MREQARAVLSRIRKRRLRARGEHATLRCLATRQRQAEGRSQPALAHERNTSTERFRQKFADGQAEAGATLVRVKATELFENQVMFFRSNPRAGVHDLDPDVIGVVLRELAVDQSQGYGAVRRVLDRVRQEIPDDLPCPHAVRLDESRLARYFHTER